MNDNQQELSQANESMHQNNNNNQEIEPREANQDDSSQFLAKRTEQSDIFYFMDPIIKNKESSKFTLEYNTFFNLEDIEYAYENSVFSVTLTDMNENKSIVGIFIFNNTPFSPIKVDLEATQQPKSPGLWEEWFNENFIETKVNGKSSLWLIYFCLDPYYVTDLTVLKQIFHKIHLSLYTTLSTHDTIMMLLSKNQYNETLAFKDQPLNEGDSPVASATIYQLIDYLYENVDELSDEEKQKDTTNSTTQAVVLINRRLSVFPIIEIRIGVEFDHDDLENIFKLQTSKEITNQFEDFFIAKMIANQDDTNKVLVGQVNDKAIGMLAISTDINVQFLIQNFELENYDNLLKQGYMKAVNYKRKKIATLKETIKSEDTRLTEKAYLQEIMKCERIPQRLYLQEYIIERGDYIGMINDIEKVYPSKEELTTQVAIKVINELLEQFAIIYPDLEQFEGKIKVSEGECLLSDTFNFFIETLEFFGLPQNYMNGNGHWDDWLEKEAEKRKQKEKFRKQLGQTSKIRTHRANKKDNEEPVKPSYFDFSPLGKALGLLKDANLTVRTFLRKTIAQNRNLIAGFFVNEKGEPSEERCFDIMSLHKKLSKAGIAIPLEFSNKIGPILLCFGNLPYTKHIVQKMPEEEVKVIVEKKETKKKKAAKKKEIKEEDEGPKEIKPINVTVYDVSISDFFKAVETSFIYDKLLFEMNKIKDEDFSQEYDAYKKCEQDAYIKSQQITKSSYETIVEESILRNQKESESQMELYNEHLKDYNDETQIPPTPNDVLNAFCVKLFFIEQPFESRSSDFLMQAFDLFPDKDYLILTQPHSFLENSLLENFIKIEKKVNSLFGEVLYILHRESLMITLLKVTYATIEDLNMGSYLFEQLNEEGNNTFAMAANAINNPSNSKFICLVCKINQSIVGICLLSKEININYYDSHFSIRDYMNLDKISKYFHSRIVFFASHKNFIQYTKIFMKEILRLVNKISLYYEVSPDIKKCPKFFKDFILSRNRKFPHFIIKHWEFETELYEDEKIKSRLDGEEREELDENESGFCLNYLSKKMMSESRIANNNRIVVVGASDTGISFIESLLSIRYLEFSYIYLVAPGGLLYHHIDDEINNLKVSINNYQIKDLKKLLLEQRIKIINSKVVDIKPKSKYIQFEDLTILNYDYLVLTLGLQDRLWKDITVTSTNMIDEIFKGFKEIQDELENKKDSIANIAQLNNIQLGLKDYVKEIIFSIDDPKIYEKFSITDKKVISLRKNPKCSILLYGRNINLFCFIQGLIKRRVPPSKITLVIPVMKSKKEDMSIDDLLLVNGTSMEDCKEVNVFMIEKLRSLGVTVHENLLFAGVTLQRQEFTDPTNIKAELSELVIETFKFHEEGKDHVENIATSLIVTGGMLDVDPIVFKFIHENGLVYNGRGIINNNFLTADNSIFAAGKLCEFSKCYTEENHRLLKLECYNSQEVGYTLAKYFLQTIDSQLNIESSTNYAYDKQRLPTFYLPQLTGCYLPGDYIFIKAKSVKETNKKIIESSNNRLPLTYNTLNEGGCYLSFIFNTFGIIDTVIYLGRDKVDYRALVSLVGLHENYLNQLLTRFDSKLVENIPLFLSENWAMAIYHDKFSQLVIKLKAILHEEDIKNIVEEAIIKQTNLDRNEIKSLLNKVEKKTQLKIEWEIVSFLSENRNQLPFYHIPLLKEPGQ